MCTKVCRRGLITSAHLPLNWSHGCRRRVHRNVGHQQPPRSVPAHLSLCLLQGDVVAVKTSPSFVDRWGGKGLAAHCQGRACMPVTCLKSMCTAQAHALHPYRTCVLRQLACSMLTHPLHLRSAAVHPPIHSPCLMPALLWRTRCPRPRPDRPTHTLPSKTHAACGRCLRRSCMEPLCCCYPPPPCCSLVPWWARSCVVGPRTSWPCHPSCVRSCPSCCSSSSSSSRGSSSRGSSSTRGSSSRGSSSRGHRRPRRRRSSHSCLGVQAVELGWAVCGRWCPAESL